MNLDLSFSSIRFYFLRHIGKKKVQALFLSPSEVSPNTLSHAQGSLHQRCKHSPAYLRATLQNWRFSEGTKVRSKHFFYEYIRVKPILFTSYFFHFFMIQGQRYGKIRIRRPFALFFGPCKPFFLTRRPGHRPRFRPQLPTLATRYIVAHAALERGARDIGTGRAPHVVTFREYMAPSPKKPGLPFLTRTGP